MAKVKTIWRKTPLTEDEVEFIKARYKMMGATEIGRLLHRDPRAIRRTINKNKESWEQLVEDMDGEFRSELRSKYYWPEIRKQLTEEESSFFIEMWCDLRKQFTDIVATEENQIVDYIRLEVLKNRAMADCNKADARCNKLMVDIANFQSKHGPPPYDDDDLLEEFRKMNEEVDAHQNSLKHRTAEINKLLERQESLRKTLRGNRDQRIQIINDSKLSFQDWIKMLMDEKNRKVQGEMLSLMREAAKKERDRLSEFHQYADGEIDVPILNSETVGGDEIIVDETEAEAKAETETQTETQTEEIIRNETEEGLV